MVAAGLSDDDLGIYAAAGGYPRMALRDVPSREVTAGGETSQSCSGFLQRRALSKLPRLMRTAALAGWDPLLYPVPAPGKADHRPVGSQRAMLEAELGQGCGSWLVRGGGSLAGTSLCKGQW